MANAFWGSGIAACDGNWNTVANWFSSQQTSNSSTNFPAVPLGRVPGAGDTAIFTTTGANPFNPAPTFGGNVTTGPSGGFAGALLLEGPPAAVSLTGTFSGTVTIATMTLNGTGIFSGTVNLGVNSVIGAGSFSGPVNIGSMTKITGGTFTGQISNSQFNLAGTTPWGASQAALVANFAQITGGSFTGPFALVAPTYNSGSAKITVPIYVSGGIWSPAFTINVASYAGTSWPENPGFGVTGGTYSPTITFTGQSGGTIPAIINPLTSVGKVGVPFSYQILATASPTSYAASGLPTGLSVNTSTGLISGTPTSSAISTITISATNGNGTGTQTLFLTVAAAATSPSESILEQDQLDIYARIQNDPYFVAGVPVLLQLKGITERDVAQAISTANQSNGLVGSVVIVLMPTLLAQDPDAPGPRYNAVYKIQVIDWPVMRRQAVGGTEASADEISDRVREIVHRFTMGRGQSIYFGGMEPEIVPDGKVSYVLRFKRVGADAPPVSVASVGIAPAGPGPATVTLTCATAGAAIWYTVDGSYPGSNRTACPTSTLYTGPFPVAAGVTVRAAGELTGYQQSQAISQVSY